MVKIVNKNIAAKSHPAHYLMHRYWGRKPHNVINHYILNYTKEGDAVLDPFMGSGVVIIESAKLNRKSIGIDLNPLSPFVTKNTLEKIDLDQFEKIFKRIYEKNYESFSKFYKTKCSKCSNLVFFENSIWEEENFKLIRGNCYECGKFIKKTDQKDKKLFELAKKKLKEEENKKNIFYPKDEILQYVKRSNKTHIHQLFTERALLILSSIRSDIEKIVDKKIKELVLLTFSSMLPSVSKMIPGNKKNVNGKSGWVVSKLWAPKIHTEKNIFSTFFKRFKKIKEGKQETNYLVKTSNAKIINSSSENMPMIKTNSIDYIFTDPPYGQNIAYFGLSMFWNSWLKKKVDYKNEIIFDPYRSKKYEDYGLRLSKVFKECYRVLKPKKFMSFTFHNRDLKIWKQIIDAVTEAGFELKNIVYQEQAVQSGTQGLNYKNTFKGDFIYNFIKFNKSTKIKLNGKIKIEDVIIKKVKKLIEDNSGYITSDKLYEKMIPEIVKKNMYVNQNGDAIDIEKILERKFSYVKIRKNASYLYAWKKLKMKK